MAAAVGADGNLMDEVGKAVTGFYCAATALHQFQSSAFNANDLAMGVLLMGAAALTLALLRQ